MPPAIEAASTGAERRDLQDIDAARLLGALRGFYRDQEYQDGFLGSDSRCVSYRCNCGDSGHDSTWSTRISVRRWSEKNDRYARLHNEVLRVLGGAGGQCPR